MRKVNAFEQSKGMYHLGDASNDMTTAIGDLDSGEQDSGITNHYEVPNLSSMLYEFTNREAERVAMGFRTGNYVGLRDLPKHLMAGNVSQIC